MIGALTYKEAELKSNLLTEDDELGPEQVVLGEDTVTKHVTAGFDSLIGRYFEDVRCHDLLTFPEEQALWERIGLWENRLRRALYCSPIALHVLSRIPGPEQSRLGRIREAVVLLRKVSDDLARMKKPSKGSQVSRRARRARRQKSIRLWQDWMAICEALELPDSVYDMLQSELESANETCPDDMNIRVAYRLWRCAQRKFEDARAAMMKANLRLVIHVANRYRNRGVLFLDLIQEGNMGLMRALDKFEPERGLKFVTYAHWWIRQAVSRAVSEQYRTVRLPCHVVERKGKLYAADEKLWDQLGRAPSVAELSVALGWTTTQVENLLTAIQPITRLEYSVSDEGHELVDLLADEEELKPEAMVADKQLNYHLSACLNALPEREAFIIRMRYGFESERSHTLQEIADVLDLSRERVRQLEKVAFERLRQPEWSQILSEFAQTG